MDNRIADITDPSVIVAADNCTDLYFKLFNNMYDGLSVFEYCGSKVRALYLNERYFENVGYTKEQYRPYYDNITVTLLEEDEKKIFKCVNDCMKSGKDIRCDVRGYKADGSVGWFCVKARPVDFIKSANPVFLATITDITERKKLDLMINSERYRILKETVSALLFEYKPFDDRMIFSHGDIGEYVIENYTVYLRKGNRIHPHDVNYYFNTLSRACRKTSKGFIDLRSYYSAENGYAHYRVFYSSIADEYGSVISVVGRVEPISRERGTQPVSVRQDSRETFGLSTAHEGMPLIESKIASSNSTGFLAIIDVDDLSEINEKFGEETGTRIIRTAAGILSDIFTDAVIFRYYGDEFVVYIENITETQLFEMFDRLLLAAKNTALKDNIPDFTFSAGFAYAKNNPEKKIQVKDYFITADKALFKAKQDGKNRMYSERVIF